MSLGPLLGLGLVLGLRHALEADHVAAVAALATRAPSWRGVLRVAASWGVGHALVLMAVGLAVTVLGVRLPAWLGARIETVAGLVLVALGLDVLRRLRVVRAQVHRHPSGGSPRAMLVCGLHGLAGSAALVVAMAPVGSAATVLFYLALFGLGSILGMGLCSLAIFLPLQAGARRSTGLASGLQLTVGACSVVLGLWLAIRPFG